MARHHPRIMLQLFIYISGALLFINKGQAHEPCSTPAKEGSENHRVHHWRLPTEGTVVQWFVVLEGIERLIYDGYANPPNLEPALFFFDEPPRSIVIRSVTRRFETSYIYLENDVEVFSCFLQVYKVPSTPTCSNITVLDSGTAINRCTTRHVYPSALCRLYVGQSWTSDSTITYSSEIESGDPDDVTNPVYYTTTCEINTYVVELYEPGKSISVSVKMWPDVEGLTAGEDGVPSDSQSLSLVLPTVTLTQCADGPNVVDGYLRKGQSTTCSCDFHHPGVPRGQLEWSTTSGGDFEELDKTIDSATIQINSAGTYQCEGKSILRSSNYDNSKKTLNSAYGPTGTTVTLDPPGPMYRCSDQPQTQITCSVDQDSYNPDPMFTITTSQSSGPLLNQGLESLIPRVAVDYNVTSPGTHTVTCLARNRKFPEDLREEVTRSYVVYEFPTVAPALTPSGDIATDNDGDVWVRGNTVLTLTCVAPGEPGLVTSTTITCNPALSSQSLGNSSTLDVGTVGEDTTCTCQAAHGVVNQCNKQVPKLTTTGKHQMAYGPTSAELNTDGATTLVNLCPSAVPIVRVQCAVEKTDVRPGTLYNLSFSTPNVFTIDQEFLDSRTSKHIQIYDLQPMLPGSYNLSCVARNELFPEINVTDILNIDVRAPPEAAPVLSVTSSRKDNEVYEADTISIKCTVTGGTPTVDTVTVDCSPRGTNTEKGTSATLTIPQIPLTFNNTRCTCRAAHVSQCYQKTETVDLNVRKAIVLNECPEKECDSPAISIVVGLLAANAVISTMTFVLGMYVQSRRMSNDEAPETNELEARTPGGAGRHRAHRKPNTSNPRPTGRNQGHHRRHGRRQPGDDPSDEGWTYNNRNVYDEINLAYDDSELGSYHGSSDGSVFDDKESSSQTLEQRPGGIYVTPCDPHTTGSPPMAVGDAANLGDDAFLAENRTGVGLTFGHVPDPPQPHIQKLTYA